METQSADQSFSDVEENAESYFDTEEMENSICLEINNLPKENRKEYTCYFCGRVGHMFQDCYARKNGQKPNPNAPFPSLSPDIHQNKDQFGKILCRTWLALLSIFMSNVVDVFCIFYCFKHISKSTEEVRNMLSKQAYSNRKRYYQINH